MKPLGSSFPRIKMATPPTAAQWEQHRSVITEMYSRRSLKAVRTYMRETYGFLATDRMFKGRFKAWGVEKSRKHRSPSVTPTDHSGADGQFLTPMSQPDVKLDGGYKNWLLKAEEASSVGLMEEQDKAFPVSNHPHCTDERGVSSLEHRTLRPEHIDPRVLDLKASRNVQIANTTPEYSVPELPLSSSYHGAPSEGFDQTLHYRHILANAPTFTDSGYASIYHTQKASAVPSITERSCIPGFDSVADEPGEDECRTIYSEINGLSRDHKRGCILELCEVVKDQLASNISQDAWTSIKESLPELIKAFAIRLGLESRNQVNRDIMVFVHRHKGEIIDQLESLIMGVDEDIKDHSNNMSLEEKMRRWRNSLGTDVATDTTELFQGVEEPNDEDFMHSVTLNDYHRVVVGSVSFAWLAESLKKEMSLYWGSGGIHCIRQEVLANLPTGKISKSRPPNTHEVEFGIASPLLLDRLSHDSPPTERTFGQELFDSMVLVYSSCEAQVVSVKNYLGQVWPLTWKPIHALLLSMIRESRSKVVNATLQDKTEISASHENDIMLFTVSGSAHTVAECGEQLAWLVAALGARPHHKDSNAHYTPTVRRASEDSTDSKAFRNGISSFYNIEAQRADSWLTARKQKLPSWIECALPKTVAIHGYPVLRRPTDCPGIEIPAEVFLNALGSFEVIISSTNLALVGARKTVVLLKEAEDVMVWHEAQSYNSLTCQCSPTSLNRDRERGPSLKMSKLELSRHVIGSCRGMEESQAISSEMPTTPIFERDQWIDFGSISPRTDLGASFENPNSPAMTASPTNEIGQYHASPLDGNTSPNAMTLQSMRHSPFHDTDHTSGGTTVSSLDSDFFSVSDSSTYFDSFGVNTTTPIIRKIADKLLDQYRLVYSAGNSSGSSSKKSSQTSTSVPSSASQQSQFSTGPPRDGIKRKSQQLDDRDEPDEGRPAQRPPKRPRLQSPKHFACPFWKFESSAHRSCFSLKLSRIRDVKQHLSRKHTPAYYCDRCSTIFNTENQLREHVSNAAGLFCNPCATLEGISRGQRLQLSRKSDKSLSEEKQWFAIWDIVFPQHKRPMSAYLEPEIVEDVYLFQEYCRIHGGTVLAAEFQTRNPPGPMGGMDTDGQFHLQAAFRQALDSLLNDWITSRSSGSSRNDRPFDGGQRPGLELSQPTAQAGSSSDSGIGSSINDSGCNFNSDAAVMPTIHENSGQLIVEQDTDQTTFHENPVVSFGITNEDVERFLQESAVNHTGFIDLDLFDFEPLPDSVCTPPCLLDPAPPESNNK